MPIDCNKSDHDLLFLQDRLMDRIAALDPEVAAEFKYFTKLYRRRFLLYGRQETISDETTHQATAIISSTEHATPLQECCLTTV